MFCGHCGSKLSPNSTYCSSCGKQANQELENKQNFNAPERANGNDEIVNAIANIKNSGFASISYWTIIFSKKYIYFFDLGKNYGYGIFGAINDLLMSQKSKSNIDELIKKSKANFKFGLHDIDKINYSKKISGGKIIFQEDGNQDKEISIKLSGGQFKKFIKYIQDFKS